PLLQGQSRLTIGRRIDGCSPPATAGGESVVNGRGKGRRECQATGSEMRSVSPAIRTVGTRGRPCRAGHRSRERHSGCRGPRPEGEPGAGAPAPRRRPAGAGGGDRDPSGGGIGERV